jgi:hypothetical protein
MQVTATMVMLKTCRKCLQQIEIQEGSANTSKSRGQIYAPELGP